MTPIPTPAATITSIPLPDLAISSVVFEPESPAPCYNADELGVRLTISNQGNADADAFVVQVNGAQQTAAQGLPRGESISLWFQGYTQENPVAVDIQFQIEETDETNNEMIVRFVPITASIACTPTAAPPAITLTSQSILTGHTAKVWSVDFSPDGRLLASGSVDDTLRLWRVFDSSLLRTMQGHPFPILTV